MMLIGTVLPHRNYNDVKSQCYFLIKSKQRKENRDAKMEVILATAQRIEEETKTATDASTASDVAA